MPKQKMKCLYITFNGLMDPLGQSQVLPYIESLSKKGIEFYLISLEKIKDKNKIKKLKTKLKNTGIKWYKLRYFKCYLLGMVFNILQCFLMSFYLITLKRIKIIHVRAYPPLFSVFLFKKIFKIKIIFDMRGFWPEELIDSKRIKEKTVYYKVLKYLERKSVLSSDWVITLTPEAKEIIKEKFNIKNVEWMPTCVDESKFKEISSVSFRGKFVIVYSGSLWSFYNMPAMTDFFIALKRKIPNAHFLILGNNETDKLKVLFLEKGIQEKDYTILTLDPEDVPNYLNSCDMAISFIYDTYSKKAAFPTKIAEYLMAGLPVVINAQTKFLEDMVVKNKLGLIIKDPDKDNFEKASDELQLFLKDKDIKLRCKKIAQEYLGKNVCVDKYVGIYQKIG